MKAGMQSMAKNQHCVEPDFGRVAELKFEADLHVPIERGSTKHHLDHYSVLVLY